MSVTAPRLAQPLPSLLSPKPRISAPAPSAVAVAASVIPTEADAKSTDAAKSTMDPKSGPPQRRSPDSVGQPHMDADSGEMDANERNLRESLLAAARQSSQSSSAPQLPQHSSSSSRHMASGSPPSPSQQQQQANPPQHMEYHAQNQRNPAHQIDPAIAAAQYGMQHVAQQSSQLSQQAGSPDMSMSGMEGPHGIAPMPEGGLPASPPDGQGGTPESRRAKRELSQSKRAAQNRAAQRAFRQRKESYIKKLEDDVRNAAALPALQEEYHRVQAENYHLRDYIMALQSRLLEVHGDYPPAPGNIELRDPRQFQQQHGDASGQAPLASMGSAGAVDQLQAAAAQAAGFGSELDDKDGRSAPEG